MKNKSPMEGKYFDFKKRRWIEEKFFPWGDSEYIAFYGITPVSVGRIRKLKAKWTPELSLRISGSIIS